MVGTPATVTGLGLYTPAGLGVAPSWDRVCAGTPAASRDALLAGLPVDISCRVPVEPSRVLGARACRRMDRVAQLAVVAAREAVADARLDPATWDADRVGVVLGCAEGGVETREAQHRILLDDGAARVSPHLLPMGLPNMAAARVSMDVGARGPSLVVSTACASGATAIGIGRNMIAAGQCDVVVAGGSEAMVTPLVVAGFAQMGALSGRVDDAVAASRPFDADRDGFVIAEGAAALVLERPEHARSRGARVRGSVAGFGASADAHHVTSPDPDGRGGEQAMLAALRDAGLSPHEVDHVNAHGTSTPLNDRIEATMIGRVLGSGPVVTSTKGVTGHMLGAAGAAEAVFSVLAVQEDLIPPTANLREVDIAADIRIANRILRRRLEVVLSDSFGFGGQNAVLVITKS